MQKTTRFPRWLLLMPFGLMLLLTLVWTGVWIYASRRAEAGIEQWLQREAQRGRVWTCPDRRIGGFPFMIRIRCEEPRFSSNQFGRPSRGTVKRLTAFVRLVDPTHLIAVADGPFVFSPDDAARVELNWSGARASVRGTPGRLSEAAVELRELVLDASAGDGSRHQARAAGLDLHARSRPEGDPATIVVGRIDKLVTPGLDRLIDNAEPLDFELQASIEKLVPALGGRPVERVEAWRQAGGEVRLVLLKASKGAMGFDVMGNLGLDDERRLAGEIRGQATGLMPLLQRFGVAPRMSGPLGGLLGGLAGDGGRLPIVLRLREGRAWFGPLPLGRLPPVY